MLCTVQYSIMCNERMRVSNKSAHVYPYIIIIIIGVRARSRHLKELSIIFPLFSRYISHRCRRVMFSLTIYVHTIHIQRARVCNVYARKL